MTEPLHSPLGASGASRWLACPPSYGLAQRLQPEDNESEHAALGTAAHKLADICLASGKDAWEYIGETVEGFVVGLEDGQVEPDAVQVYLDYVRPLAEAADKAESELRLGTKWKPHPLYGGTADFVAAMSDAIHVVDYKHGAGLGVEAVGSPQLQYYAIGAFKELASHLPDTAAVHMTIVQPRYAGPPIKTWTITVGELRAWSRDVMVPGMLKAEASAQSWTEPHGDPAPEGNYSAGEHCRFCPVILDCPKQRADFESLEKDPERMTDEELDSLFPRISTVKMYMRAIEGRLQARLMEGAAFNQVKLVAKRAAGRVWKEGAFKQLQAWLGDEAYESREKSPAQVEKLSKKGKDFVAENAFLPETTGYNLAPANDSSPAANPSTDIATAFAHY